MRLAIEKTGPGIAFWRAKKHGWDVWAWGLACLEVPDWFHWSFGVELDFDFARGMHFDELALIRLKIGPFRFKFFYIEDRKN